MYTLASFAFIVQSFVMSVFHPLHISVSEIEMDEKDQRLEIMMRVFMDDLETTLREDLRRPELDIITLSSTELDQVMERYLSSHFKIALDGKAQVTQYLGHEDEGQAFIFYIEVSKVRKWKSIQITNDIIMATFGDQSNLVHVTVGDNVKSLRLTRSRPMDTLTFD
jgi:hypothetical protein